MPDIVIGAHDFRQAEPGEPTFTLFARDINAPAKVEAWAASRESDINAGIHPDTPEERRQILAAQQIAQSMRMWYSMNRPRQEEE